MLQRQSSVQRPPSIDGYKPRRSESEAAPGGQAFGKPVKTITNPDGTITQVYNVGSLS